MQLKKSADTVFKIVSAQSGEALYAKGDEIALGPDGSTEAYLFKVDPASNSVLNVGTGKYIANDGKLSSTPHAWDLAEAGSGTYNFKVPSTGAAITIASGKSLDAVALSSSAQQTWKLVAA